MRRSAPPQKGNIIGSITQKPQKIKNIEALLEILTETPKAIVTPGFVKMTGSLTSAVMLRQLLYWYLRYKDWIYKTDQEWYDECGLTYYEARGAKENLEKLGLIETKLAGIPAKTHYRVNIENLLSLSSKTSFGKNLKQVLGKTENLNKEKPKTNKENTKEITKENKLYISTKKYSSLSDITEQDLIQIAEKYKVSIGFVRLQFEKMKNWLEATGKRKKNYKAALRNFVLGDMQRTLERKQNDRYSAVDARRVPGI